MKITSSTPINEIIKNYPEAVEVLMEYGLNCIGCRFSSEDTLETGLKIHGLDHELELVLKDLNRVLSSNS